MQQWNNRLALAPPRRAAREARGAVAWAIVLAYGAILAFVLLPNDHALPALVASAVTLALMQALCPACRPRLATPLCPLNWALLLFLVQLVAMPLLVTFAGPALGTLPFMPDAFTINAALLASTLAYVAFCVACQCAAADQVPDRAAGYLPPVWLALLFVGIGALGLALAFGSPGRLLLYYTDPAGFGRKPETPPPATLSGAASTFFRPFLGFAFVVLWCRWLERRARPRATAWASVVTAGVAIMVFLSYASFGYNRGAFLAPLLAMASVYLRRVRQLSIAALGVVSALVLAGVLFLGVFRAGDFALSTSLTDPQATQALAQRLDLSATLQVYGAAPQFLGFLLEEVGYGQELYWGRTVVGSLLDPVPVLGKPFRPSSGAVIYNTLIYGEGRRSIRSFPSRGNSS